MTTLSLTVLDPDLVTEITEQNEQKEADRAARKERAEQKKADRAARAATRLHSHVEGDPDGSRRCTHPEHTGNRLFENAIDGNGGFYRKPDGSFGGSWCGDCKRRVGKEKRAEKAIVETAPDAAEIETVPVDTDEMSELFAPAA